MIDHTPLDASQLSPGAQRALAAGPSRMMAARGLMPLPPADQAAVLYQLSLDGDGTLVQAARATAGGLPEKVLAAMLSDGSLDARVIDFFAEVAADKAGVFQVIVMNPGTADATVARLASRASAQEVDLIAQNEQRLLRHPEIIGAMYMNRRARMSTIDRVVELAVRNNVRVPGLAAWDEVARALAANGPSSGEDDGLIDAVLVSRDDSHLTTGNADQALSEEELARHEDEGADIPFHQLKTVSAKLRAVQIGNGFVRNQGIRDPSRLVAMAAIKAPGVTEIEAARYAGNQLLHEDVIRYIASKREWTKLYGIKLSLCRNPKAPIAEVTRHLPFLREKDLASIIKSKGVPSAVVAQARKLAMQRSGGQKK